MTTLNFKLTKDTIHVKEGAAMKITDRWRDGTSIYLSLHESSSGFAATVVVLGIISIGGKNYLLIRLQNCDNDEVTVTRLLDNDRIGALDRDRFSSLFNAFQLSIEQEAVLKDVQLEVILGIPPSK